MWTGQSAERFKSAQKTGLPQALLAVLKPTWSSDPKQRPTAERLREQLEALPAFELSGSFNVRPDDRDASSEFS